MKVKRYKRVQRILGFYEANFGLRAPFIAVLDGTFLMAAKQGKINLREQLPKYLCDKTEVRTTPCVLAELELLGDPVYGALHIGQTLELHPCAHDAQKTPQACLLSLAKAAAKGGADRLFLGTQDPVLTNKIRSFPGSPILFIRSQTVLLEKPAELSESQAEEATKAKRAVPQHEAHKLQLLKRAVLGDEASANVAVRRKRRAKAPNPLSCLPKKAKLPGAKKKHRRKKKKTAPASSADIDS